MSISLNSVELKATYTPESEFQNFAIQYVKDRFNICALCSYTRKISVYLYVVDPKSLKSFDYITFGNLIFRRFEHSNTQGYYYLDPPFKQISLATIVRILDTLSIVYQVDSIGLFAKVE